MQHIWMGLALPMAVLGSTSGAMLHLNSYKYSSHNGASHLLGEPLLGLIARNSLEVSELSFSVLSLGDSLSSSAEDHVEVHTEDTGVGIVLDSKIDMLFDTESEIAFTQN